jgi:hypothetical protein
MTVTDLHRLTAGVDACRSIVLLDAYWPRICACTDG